MLIVENELIVKHNTLINASYSLSVVEQRLILLAIVAIRDHFHKSEGFTANKEIEVSASSYINTFNVDPSTAYKGLREACKTLFARQFSYQENRGKGRVVNMTSRWVQKVGYIDNSATVVFTFADDVIPFITELEKHLTSYEIKQVANLTSQYAIRLYELLIAWRSVGKTPQIKLDDFRSKLGVEIGLYPKMEVFKRRVLEPAISQINEHTDIKATYEQHKEGRSIVGFSFKFKQKEVKKPIEHKKDQDTPDFFTNMTDKQRHFFASKLSEMPEMEKYSQGTESYERFASRIAEMLLNPEKMKELSPYLLKAGFNS